LILRKISKIGATKCQIIRLKCTKFNFRWGSAQTPLWELTALPQIPYLYLRGPTSKGREGKVGGEGREGRGEGKGKTGG